METQQRPQHVEPPVSKARRGKAAEPLIQLKEMRSEFVCGAHCYGGGGIDEVLLCAGNNHYNGSLVKYGAYYKTAMFSMLSPVKSFKINLPSPQNPRYRFGDMNKKIHRQSERFLTCV